MIVLVTGSNGFLGTALVSRLIELTQYDIRCLVRQGSSHDKLDTVIKDFSHRCQIVYGSLNNNQNCLDMIKGVECLFHLASAKGGPPAEMFKDSSVATRNLLEAIKNTDKSIKFVHCSSFSVYGVSALNKGELINENAPLEKYPVKRDIYSYTKLHQENLVKSYYEKHGIPTVILRPGVIYGSGGTAISPRVGLNLFGIFLFIGGKNILPLTYVDNCAEAFVVAAKSADFSGDIYNIVDDDLIDAKTFLSLYRKNVDKCRYIPIPYWLMWLLSILCEKYFKRSKGQLPDVFTRYKTASIWKPQKYSNEKLKKLGWLPRISTKEGLNNHFHSLNINK
jgi:nucleoside-diphosphate-sugar epimerase